MSIGAQYKFNIINMSKTSSQFNQGMQPCVYSEHEKQWRRTGDGVYYMRYICISCLLATHWHWLRNHYLQSTTTLFSTLTFNVTFKQPDVHYIAYHFPYTFSELQVWMLTLRYLDLLLIHIYSDPCTIILWLQMHTKGIAGSGSSAKL